MSVEQGQHPDPAEVRLGTFAYPFTLNYAPRSNSADAAINRLLDLGFIVPGDCRLVDDKFPKVRDLLEQQKIDGLVIVNSYVPPEDKMEADSLLFELPKNSVRAAQQAHDVGAPIWVWDRPHRQPLALRRLKECRCLLLGSDRVTPDIARRRILGPVAAYRKARAGGNAHAWARPYFRHIPPFPTYTHKLTHQGEIK